ncbi:MAG TPA: ATPase, T2SS/T4P/T4SS family [Planctomycetota bacterium]|nr:ATPase, T2SS/T4P/T4SS family [Planctomycetota bacterium]HJM39031.1 ATPase, T2SS/T4P/T4SS family [Planctomycetota bacterium]|tara:strand:- start:13979 stop:15952 length:1974 start_codon:yes stop_codon:yes gene_type:complete
MKPTSNQFPDVSLSGENISRSLPLPEALSSSRTQELENIFAELRLGSVTALDGSTVKSIDTDGLELLGSICARIQGIGKPIQIQSPSITLVGACRSLQLQNKIPLEGHAGDPPHPRFLGKRVGEILIELGHLNNVDLEKGLSKAKEHPDAYLGRILIEEGFIEGPHLAEALALQHALPFVLPTEWKILDVSLEHGIPTSELRTHCAVPILRFGDTLAVAVSDPSDVYAVDLIRRATSLKVSAVVTTPEEVQRGLDLIQRASGQSTSTESESISSNGSDRFDRLLLNGLIEGASDIHLEAMEDGYSLRYRVDGRLRDVSTFGLSEGREVVARIKVLAGCDIAEKRRPQDGRIHFQEADRDVDLRVSTMPTVYGEKAVMRVLDRKAQCQTLEELGLESRNLGWLRDAIQAPHGLVLVTGPTGAGKTTTLYSVLDEIVTPEINVATVENPVERAISGVNQTQVNHKAGLGFETCLHSLLRQDPDVIMIGEIRDNETAAIAVEAALTGHLVLATLHTNDAPSAATRLVQMGVEPYLVAATLKAVMAQRLLRKLCDSCKASVALPEAVRENFASSGLSEGPHFRAEGCPACRKSGYTGRLGVFEVMQIDSALQRMIANGSSNNELREYAVNRGMISLLKNGISRVNAGHTSLEEALRAGSSG